MTQDYFTHQRFQLVQKHLIPQGIKDLRVLKAIQKVPRHLFVPFELQDQAYEDYPLTIGYDQTISQPYIVAFMTQELQLTGKEQVLEIGTGCGYQTAILAELSRQVYTIEIVKPLAEQAHALLKKLRYVNIHTRIGDGRQGWMEAAPFDVIILTAAPNDVPPALLQQLREGGRMILPLASQENQSLIKITKKTDGLDYQELLKVKFVPLTGKEEPIDLKIFNNKADRIQEKT